jgi:site-specific DNA-methyltransferase (adenine-specific)
VFWKAVQAKPGAFMLAFGGTRTFHRLTCAIEDAGWEIRDCVMWLYGSGFPKSLDVSKAIDKAAGMRREVVGKSANGSGPQPHKLNAHGPGDTGIGYMDGSGKVFDITTPATEAAREWSGWGTALKPAWEPIIVARKPVEGTVAANVLKYGTGGINVDGCRVICSGESLRGGAADGSSANKCHKGWDRPWKSDPNKQIEAKIRSNFNQDKAEQLGRWPANVIHDGSEEVLAGFPESAKQLAAVRPDSGTGQKTIGILGKFASNSNHKPRGDTGSAARFFYTAKASRRDRCKYNTHPTVKPFKLVRYLTRLVSRRWAMVLDPFAGSCTLAVACEHLRRRWVCIEKEEVHCEIAAKRIEAERRQLKLF